MARGLILASGDTPSPEQLRHARRVVGRIQRLYPEERTALDYADPFQLLVSTVISAQTTDENVNKATPALFAAYPDAQALSIAEPGDVERLIYSTGFFRQKTKSIIGLAQALVDEFDGVVPASIDELVRLPGVGRKTASVVLAEAFDQPAIAVDTHVGRVSRRTGLSEEKAPERVERDLMALVPRSQWSRLSMQIIKFGRDTCDARRPHCFECRLVTVCVFPDKNLEP